MMEQSVWTPIKQREVAKVAKILDLTWAMKMKSNGKMQGRLNARGVHKVLGEHIGASSMTVAMTHYATIQVILTMTLMADWMIHIMDVKVVF